MKAFTLILSLVASHFIHAQGYEGHPCTKASTMPKELLKKKEIKDDIYIDGCDLDRGQMCSSFLKASGKAPMSVKDPNFKPPSDYDGSDGDSEYDSWTCMYAGGMAVDNNLATAWVEGVGGDGKGESLIVTLLDLSKPVEILSGFGKSPSLFIANNRPKNVKIHVLQTKRKPGGASQCGETFEGLKIIATAPATLADKNGFQPLPIPGFKHTNYIYEGNSFDHTYWLMIELVDTYPGTKYKDTCISEVRNSE